MKLLLEDCVYRTFSSLCEYFWYYVTAFCISLCVAIILALAVRLLTRKIYGSTHYATLTLLGSFVGTAYGILLYMINAQIINLADYHIWCGVAFMFFSALPLYGVWCIVKLFACIVIAIAKHETDKPKSTSRADIQLSADIEQVCANFTRAWIRTHIAEDGNRYNTLVNHKALFIAKLAENLDGTCRNPFMTATQYYEKCVNLWK